MTCNSSKRRKEFVAKIVNGFELDWLGVVVRLCVYTMTDEARREMYREP